MGQGCRREIQKRWGSAEDVPADVPRAVQGGCKRVPPPLLHQEDREEGLGALPSKKAGSSRVLGWGGQRGVKGLHNEDTEPSPPKQAVGGTGWA